MAHNQTLSAARNSFQLEQWVLENIHTFFNHLHITLHDLRNPTPEMVSKVYGAFLEELDVNTANLRLIQNNQMQLITHVDMYNISVPLINHHRCLSFFLKSLGVEKSFNVTDLVAPTSKRTLHFFEALLRFLVYCDDKIGSLKPELEKMSEMRSRRNELLQKNEVLRNEINKRAQSRTTRHDKMKNVIKAVESEKKKLDELMIEKEAQVSAQNSIKKLVEEDTVKENQLIQILQKNTDDVNKLKEMLVNSPEKLKRLLDKPTEILDELKEQEKNLKDQLEAKKQTMLTISQEQAKQGERLEKIGELLIINRDLEVEKKRKSNLVKQSAQVSDSQHEIQMLICGQEKRQKMLMETINKYNDQRKTQSKEVREQLESTQKKLNDLIEQGEKNIERLNQIQKEIGQVNADMENLGTQFTAYKKKEDDIREEHQSLKEDMFKKYNNMILKLKSINANLKKNG